MVRQAGRAHGTCFRGSAAFFAMLLAASSGLAQDAPGVESAPSDQARAATPQTTRPLALRAASKFTRRRAPLAHGRQQG